MSEEIKDFMNRVFVEVSKHQEGDIAYTSEGYVRFTNGKWEKLEAKDETNLVD